MDSAHHIDQLVQFMLSDIFYTSVSIYLVHICSSTYKPSCPVDLCAFFFADFNWLCLDIPPWFHKLLKFLLEKCSSTMTPPYLLAFHCFHTHWMSTTETLPCIIPTQGN